MLDFLNLYGSPIAWIVAAIGWGVAKHHANRLEERKEIRSEIEEACDLVVSTIEMVREYRETAPTSVQSVGYEIRIKHSLEDLSLRLARLAQRKDPWRHVLDLKDSEAQFGRFFDAVSGGDFESQDRKRGDEDRFVFLQASKRGLSLNDSLRRAFLSAFQ